MPQLLIGGGTIHYEDRGQGAPVVLTPGGMWGGYIHRVLATELSKDFRVITWDRRNADGKSDIEIAGVLSEADLWSEDLATLIRVLRLGPCYLGEYSGCRTSPLVCVKYPELVKGLMLAFPSGGSEPAEQLPRTMYRPYIRAALRHGMEAVLALKFPVGRDQQSGYPLPQDPDRENAGNRARLLALDPFQFARQMAYWEAYFTTSADLAVAGCRLADRDWASIRAPTIIIGGVDPIHPSDTAERLHRLLPNAELHAPVVTSEEWGRLFGKVPYPQVADIQGSRIAPVWRDFIKQMED